MPPYTPTTPLPRPVYYQTMKLPPDLEAALKAGKQMLADYHDDRQARWFGETREEKVVSQLVAAIEKLKAAPESPDAPST